MGLNLTENVKYILARTCCLICLFTYYSLKNRPIGEFVVSRKDNFKSTHKEIDLSEGRYQ
jgi:hypothetical protein